MKYYHFGVCVDTVLNYIDLHDGWMGTSARNLEDGGPRLKVLIALHKDLLNLSDLS